MSDDLKLWFDKDVRPYKKGENPALDELIDELTDNWSKKSIDMSLRQKMILIQRNDDGSNK